jgi:hypothetical protein
MQIWVFRIFYLHTKNELPVNDETVWSRSTRVDRPFTYDQKFRNKLFTKVKLYFSCKYEYSEYSICTQKMSYRWTMKLFDLGQLASTDLLHTLKSFVLSCLPKSNCTFHANMSIQNILSAHKKWVTGKRWNCLISINSRRQTFCIRSKVSHW